MRLGTLARTALAAVLAAGLMTPGAAATPAATITPDAAVEVVRPATSHRVTSKKAKHKAIEKHVHRLVNMTRSKEGLKKLKRIGKITKVSRAWSVQQARAGRLGHNPSYASEIPSGWTRASENVAWTTARGSAKKLAKRIVRAWLDSPGHRANILGSAYTKTGVGVARSSKHGWYFTQNFSN